MSEASEDAQICLAIMERAFLEAAGSGCDPKRLPIVAISKSAAMLLELGYDAEALHTLVDMAVIRRELG